MSAQPRGPGRLVAWFRENLAFRPEDRRSALLVVVLHAIVGSALVVAFTARDAIFLSTTPDKLPLAYLVAAVASGFAAAGVSSLRRRLPAELLLPIASTLAGSILFALGLLAWKKGDAAAGRFIFMLVDAIAAAVIVPTWSLTESTFSARDTGRVISLVNAGRLIVVLVAGLWTYAIVQVLAPCWLLVVAAVLLWLSSIPVILLGLRRALRGVPVRVTLPPGEVLAARLRTLAMPHVSLLAVVMVLGVIVATLVDFQFKTAVAAKFPGDAAGIARFASGYASFSGGLALVLTLAAAPFLYARYGVGGVLVGCAVATAAGMGSIFFGLPVLIAAGISKSTHELFRFSGADSTLPTFLAPLPRQLRDDVGGFIRSYVIPFASIGAAVLIVGTERWRLAVPAATVVGAALLVVALNRFRTEFTRSRRYGAARVVTDDGASFVPAALLSPDRREVETALELAPRIRVDFTASVVPLIVHPEPRIRRLALDYLASRPTPETKNPELSDRVRQCLGDAEPDVRVSAIQALCVLERAGALGDLLGFLNAPESRVRAAAAAALFFHGGSTGQAAGARPLMRLLGSSDPAEREAI
ncbi:MAG: HEAT repeat domain-containing protein, partial [Planctomycetota bacterium]